MQYAFLIYLLISQGPVANSQVMDPSTLMFGGSLMVPSASPSNPKDLPPRKTKKSPKTQLKISENIRTPAAAFEPPKLVCEQAPVIDNYVFPIVKEQREGLGPSLQNTFFGGDFESLDLYRKSLTEEDRRKNIFELDFGFQYFYNNSQSNYFYRNYNSNAPGIEIQPRFWLTPFLGLHVLYDFSLMNTVGNSPTQNTSTSVTLQNLKFGLSLRRYFSSKPDGSSATFNLNYLDHQFQAPSGDAGRMSIRYRGVDLSMDFSIPSSPKYFWVFGFNVAPNLMGEEAEGSRNLTSGTASTSLLYGGFLGGEYVFSRQFQTYFKFSAQVFKTQFSGTSRASDPVTGTNLSNVSVSDGIYMLTLGVRFGR